MAKKNRAHLEIFLTFKKFISQATLMTIFLLQPVGLVSASTPIDIKYPTRNSLIAVAQYKSYTDKKKMIEYWNEFLPTDEKFQGLVKSWLNQLYFTPALDRGLALKELGLLGQLNLDAINV